MKNKDKNLLKTVLNPGYFGAIDWFSAFWNAEEVLWEHQDNYQKQTYRNRQYIYGANGRLSLNIPVCHAGNKSNRQKYREVKIDNKTPWQKIHWKSLESAYRTSSFFEFYEDDFAPLYNQPFTYLIDFNHSCINVLTSCLQIDKPAMQTKRYHRNFHAGPNLKDFRHLIEAKRQPAVKFPVYDQVFLEKHGFISNLSILDLLFNQGPQTSTYLERNAVL